MPENAAMEKNIHPEHGHNNIKQMKSQPSRWDYQLTGQEFATCDATYYKYQQELFIDMLEKSGIQKSLVNWDPVDKTVLTNEQVENGKG